MGYFLKLLANRTQMTLSTDTQINLDSFIVGDPISRRQGARREIKPVIRPFSATTTVRPKWPNNTALGEHEVLRQRFDAPTTSVAVSRELSPNSTPLQIWEGTVLNVDREDSGIMQVLLDAKIGMLPSHTGEIELEWVADQDQDLVCPGAVFYLTLSKRTKRGSIENTQELRFRRRPSWSEAQLKQIEHDAAILLSKMKMPSTAT